MLSLGTASSPANGLSKAVCAQTRKIVSSYSVRLYFGLTSSHAFFHLRVVGLDADNFVFALVGPVVPT